MPLGSSRMFTNLGMFADLGPLRDVGSRSLYLVHSPVLGHGPEAVSILAHW